MQTPDLTKAQLLALAQAAVATAVSFGAPISATGQDKLMGLAAVVATAIVAADTFIRRGRQKHLSAGAMTQAAVSAILTELEQHDEPAKPKPLDVATIADRIAEAAPAEAPPPDPAPADPRSAL